MGTGTRLYAEEVAGSTPASPTREITTFQTAAPGSFCSSADWRRCHIYARGGQGSRNVERLVTFSTGRATVCTRPQVLGECDPMRRRLLSLVAFALPLAAILAGNLAAAAPK